MKLFAVLLAFTWITLAPVVGQISLPSGSSSSVSSEKTIQIQRSAAELLSRYIKLQKGNFLLHAKSGFGEFWVESRDLALSRVSPYLVNAVDRANGIEAIHMVDLNSTMHRTYDPKTTKWTDWQNGRHLFLPAAIRVTERNDGQFIAESSMLSNFTAFTARGNPYIIPCVRERVIQPPVSLPKIQKPEPISAPASKDRPAQPNAMQAATQEIIKKAVGVAVVIVVFFGITGVLASLLQGKRKLGYAHPTVRSPLPPPLSVESLFPPDHSLIVAQTHLLTPAERSFLAVLEPIVRPTCAVSTKVRLADLFQVKQGRGQQSAFNRISRKHVDFVLTDPATSRILCAIELDDSSHNRPDRIARDQFVDALFAINRMRLVHIPFEWKYNPSAIRTKLIQAGVPLIDPNPPGAPPPLPAD